MISGAARYFPILDWARRYDRPTLGADLLAAGIVTIMLIPQSLAYATLAGLPPQMGLYASVAPLLVYAVFGTSRAMAIGPVAVISLMTASAASRIGPQGSPDYIGAALILAMLCGLMTLLMGLLRLGALAKLLSNPVVNGFTIASSVIIAASQLGPLLGIATPGQTITNISINFAAHVQGTNGPTATIGILATAFLFWVRKGFKPLLVKIGLPKGAADVIAKAGPILAIALTTAAVVSLDLEAQGVRIVGDIPKGLPTPAFPSEPASRWIELLMPALFISIIGFVSSISVAQTLAAKRRQKVDPSQEMIALGVSNVAAAVTGAFPVTGGFARSVVNFDAGAQTPAAGAYTALGIAIAALLLTPLLYHLPIATLAATIIVAVLSLVNIREVIDIWRYSKNDFAAMAATIIATLFVGVEVGLAIGVALSVLLYLYRSSEPHVAVVGQVPGTQHFRNVLRHSVVTSPEVITLRIDESLTFTNASWLESKVMGLIGNQRQVKHVILMFSAVNAVDASALESLMSLNLRLQTAGIDLHLSEVKGPVMDRLERSTFLQALTGRIFLSQYDAFRTLAPKACDALPPDTFHNTDGAGI